MYAKKANLQHRKMTEGNIVPLMLRISIPSTIAMIVIALYSLADSFYVSTLSTEAGAAVGVCFAIQATIQAVAYTLGVGAGSLLSRKLGEKDGDTAARFARVSLLLAIGTGILIMGVGLALGESLIRFLGATELILPFAYEYSRYLLFSAPFMCTSFVLSQLLRAEGKAVYSMAGLLCGSLLNIVLDHILIKCMEFGIAGASIATLISQIVCFLILLSAYVIRYSQIHLFADFSFSEFRETGKILIAGLPSSGRQGLTALSTILLNHATATWGDAAVAAMAVVSRLFLLAFAFCLGVGQGMMPVTGYNYGYRQFDRVEKAYRFAWIFSTLLMLFIALPFLLFSAQLIAFFREDPDVIAIGAPALRAMGSILILHGTITCTNMLLQSIGKQVAATVLACARQGIFFIPILFFLPSQFGIEALILVQPLADLLTFFFTLPFIRYAFLHLRKKKDVA